MNESKPILTFNGIEIEGVTVDHFSLSECLPPSRIQFPLQSEYTITMPIHFSSKRKLRKMLISVSKNPRYRGPRKTT